MTEGEDEKDDENEKEQKSGKLKEEKDEDNIKDSEDESEEDEEEEEGEEPVTEEEDDDDDDEEEAEVEEEQDNKSKPETSKDSGSLASQVENPTLLKPQRVEPIRRTPPPSPADPNTSGNPTVVDDALQRALSNDPELTEVNLNNIDDVSQVLKERKIPNCM